MHTSTTVSCADPSARKSPPHPTGLIGFGAIGRSIVAAWQRQPVPGHRLTAVLVRPHQLAEAQADLPPGITATDSIATLLALAPHTVVEAAGQPAVAQHAEQVLLHGTCLLVLSVGSLADAALHARLQAAALAGGAPLLLPVGAIAGLDGLMALRQAGLRRVQYTSTKPPLAWLGTPAESQCDLRALRAPQVVFEGTARDAARLFPKNANLAAAVALAGLGFERTTVQLGADPAATGNTGRIQAEGEFSWLDVTVSGSSSGSNPKTSGLTGFSVLALLANQASAIRFG